jgi:purine-nucleoside phosphorylase
MLETKKKILLIPYFWDRNLYKELIKDAVKVNDIFLSQYIEFKNYSIITGFMGYPHILTILGMINNLKEKDFFFLGTAGAVDDTINSPISLNITDIYSSSVLKLFSKQNKFHLKKINEVKINYGKCVSVDIPSRETKQWLQHQRNLKIDVVEMELFPIRAFIQKPFTAMLIVTDKVRENKKIRLMNIKLIKKEFSKSFQLIKTEISSKSI